MTHVELFAGIGGISIAAEWAGFRTIAQVEIDPWRRRVLEKRFPGVRRWSDIRDFPGEWDPGAITLISGGFPCPPYSQAGKRLGKNDPRHLWPQMARVIRELKSTWVVAENVAGAVALVLDDAITDLEEAGYSVWPIVFPALALGAWHERQRLFIVAHLDSSRRKRAGIWEPRSRENAELVSDGTSRDPADSDKTGREYTGNRGKQVGVSRSSITAESVCNGAQRSVADSAGERCKGQQISARSREEGERKIDVERADADSVETGSALPVERNSEAKTAWQSEPCHGDWWETERGLVRVVHGLPRWLDKHRRRRVAALGDSCVPAQVYPILQAIAEVENGSENNYLQTMWQDSPP